MTAATEEHVRSVIASHVAGVMPGIRAEQIDFDATLSDYGCNSLDRADIVSLSMEELGIDVRVTELSRVTNLRELSDALCRHVHAA